MNTVGVNTLTYNDIIGIILPIVVDFLVFITSKIIQSKIIGEV